MNAVFIPSGRRLLEVPVFFVPVFLDAMTFSSGAAIDAHQVDLDDLRSIQVTWFAAGHVASEAATAPARGWALTA
jgi:hypothetical protein